MVGTPRESRVMRTAGVRAGAPLAPSSRGSEARTSPMPSVSAASRSTTAAAPMYFSVRMRAGSVQRDLEDLHGVGAALHAGQFALGENHQVALLDQLQLEQPREQRAVQVLGGVVGPGDGGDHRVDTAVEGHA